MLLKSAAEQDFGHLPKSGASRSLQVPVNGGGFKLVLLLC